MKKLITSVAVLLFTSTAFALSHITCNVHMQNKGNISARKTLSPILSGQGLNSVIRAKDHLFFLTFDFNPQTVSTTKAHVILDGRYKHVPMNVHMSVEERNNVVTIVIRDTESELTDKKDFEINSVMSLVLRNSNALFEVECQAQP